MAQSLIHMTEARHDVIKSLIDGKINGADASKQIGVSARRIKRLKVVKLGAAGLAHGNRGKDSNRKLDDEILKKAEELLKKKYYDFGPKFTSEKLYENDKIKLGKETTRGIMTKIGLWKPKPRKQPKKRRACRARKKNFGEMEQFDGSYHIWFGEEESCLLLSVDFL